MCLVLCFQMYGEKVEEANELKLDLMEVKDLLRAQIQEFTCEAPLKAD